MLTTGGQTTKAQIFPGHLVIFHFPNDPLRHVIDMRTHHHNKIIIQH